MGSNIVIEIARNIFGFNHRKRVLVYLHQSNNPIGVALHHLLEDIARQPSVAKCLVSPLGERLEKTQNFMLVVNRNALREDLQLLHFRRGLFFLIRSRVNKTLNLFDDFGILLKLRVLQELIANKNSFFGVHASQD